MRSRSRDGRIRGTDGSVWLYRALPLAPVADARSPEEGLAPGEPLNAILGEIASSTTVRVPRRAMSKSLYRDIHILLVNIPMRFTPPEGSQLTGYLSGAYPTEPVNRRLVLFGVKLRDRVGGGGGVSAAVDSVVQVITTGTVPMSDYDADFVAMDGLMARSGLISISSVDYRLANAWWNHGQSPDSPMLVHTDHIHVFGSSDSARAAAGLVERYGDDSCGEWVLPSHHTVSFGCVQDFDLPYVEESSRAAQWAGALVDAEAVCISIRGQLEPPQVTRGELRRRKKQAIDDETERSTQNKMSRSELEERLAELDQMEAAYAIGGPPALIDCSTVVAFTGMDPHRGYDMSGLAPPSSGLVLTTMTARQNTAMAETWLASPIRANPYLHDIPAHTIAASGLPNLSTVGDRDGALMGFTERDRQPAYLTAAEASETDALPIFICAGQTGSGKTLQMLFLADQFARQTNMAGQRRGVIIIDPKAHSAHDAAVLSSGGRVASLDELTSADGVFDPLRFAARTEVGVELAASVLMSVNPWGTNRSDYETPLIKALAYGANKGADCIGVALQMALEDGQAPHEMVSRVFDLAGAAPMFRACVGTQQGGPRLRTDEGITLIKVGEAYLDLPEPGAVGEANQQQRIALALVRLMVFGSAMALTGRQGVLMLDEAWVMLSAGRSEVERLGRLARSQQVLPMLFTQRISDALNAGLAGYISRGMILPIQDREEAIAACELFKLEPTPQRIDRITAKALIGGTAGTSSRAPNWTSMRALRDPKTGRVLRGTIGIYVDLSGRAVPIEVKVPSDFLLLASTNPEDIRQRVAAAAVEAVAQ